MAIPIALRDGVRITGRFGIPSLTDGGTPQPFSKRFLRSPAACAMLKAGTLFNPSTLEAVGD